MPVPLAELESALTARAARPDLQRGLELTRAAVATWSLVTASATRWAEVLLARLGDGAPLDAPGLYLACACLEGDRVALTALEGELRAAATPALRRLGLQGAKFDEVLQNARTHLLVADDGAPRLTRYSGRAPLREWLSTVCARQAFDLGRKQRDVESLGAVAARAAEHDPEHAVVRADQRAHVTAAIAAALETLTPRQRALLRLHVVEHLSIDQLAPMFGGSRASLARWVEDAREALGRATRGQLAARLALDTAELDSLVHSARQSLDLSLERLLARDS